MRRVLVLVLVALGCVLVTEAPAQACDRPAAPLAKSLQRATFVFSGKVTRVTSAGKDTTFAVTVDRAYEGRVDEEVMVTAPRTKAACGLTTLRRGDAVLFVVRDGSGDAFRTASFEGTRALTGPVRSAVVRALGKGSAPIAPAPAAEDPPLEMVVVDDGQPMSFGALALPGGVLVALGLLTLVVAQLLGRRPSGS